MPIPSRLHFCWIGNSLPWAYVFAILSASARSEMDEIILHHTDQLEDGPQTASLRAAPRVRLHRTDPAALLAETDVALGMPGDGRLLALYGALRSPVMRSDILRAAILFQQGGIYLDLDTLVVASLRPLLKARQFVGTERIVWPEGVRRSRSPAVWAKHLSLDVLRKLLRAVPGGWRAFRAVEGIYALGINNAVMGSEPGAPLFKTYLHRMQGFPAAQQTEAYALGPDMLQGLVAHYAGGDLIIHEPAVFYPFPPEISEHLFRSGRALRDMAQVLPANTRVVHWYGSVRTRARTAPITPAYVLAQRGKQLYSALLCAALGKNALGGLDETSAPIIGPLVAPAPFPATSLATAKGGAMEPAALHPIPGHRPV